MKLIKLNATDSTNDYLKRLQLNADTENWTVVTALSQTAGKGQMGSVWLSEEGKNLTMSILVMDSGIQVQQIFSLNIAVSVAIIIVLEKMGIPNLAVKWPNDIMSGNKKIGGILIENTIKTNTEIISIIGIGLNVNQTNFQNLPKASSLSKIMKKEFDSQMLLKSIFDALQFTFLKLSSHEIGNLWNDYNRKLFKIGIPMPFEKPDGIRFMAIIEEVNVYGKLVLKLEDDSVKAFELKEIAMLY